MLNCIQHYAWGSKNALTELYGIDNPNNLPMAELWMGAHPKSSSAIIDEKGNTRNLRDVIAEDATTHLGATIAQRFGELPFCLRFCARNSRSPFKFTQAKHRQNKGLRKKMQQASR